MPTSNSQSPVHSERKVILPDSNRSLGTQTADDMSRTFAFTTRLEAIAAWGRRNALWPDGRCHGR